MESEPPISRPAGPMRAVFAIGVVALFLVACATDVYHLAPYERSDGTSVPLPPVSGVAALAGGWLGPLVGVVAWYANPLLALGLFWAGRSRGACYAALAALAVGGTSFLITHYHQATPHGGSAARRIAAWGVGFYAWNGALLLLAVAALGYTALGPGRQGSGAPPAGDGAA